MTRRVWLFVFCLLATAGPGFAQGTPAPSAPVRHPEEGRPFIRGYRPVELGGGGQNWTMIQDTRGVIYVGSQSGVLEFDGASWRLIETPTLDTVRSLAIDAAGRIYVGSVGDFGYLDPDASGELKYVSLLDRVPEADRRFSDVWRTFVTKDGVLFEGEQVLFRWANETITVLHPPSRFNRASLVDGQMYVTMPESGLNVLEGDTFRALPGTMSLAREVYPVVLRYDERRLLVGTRSNGLFLYDGSALVPFPTELDALIKSGNLYRGIVMPSGTIAFAMTRGGLAIMDRQGRLVTALDQNHGLPSNAVYYLMTDREGAVWAALERGVARIETPSPVSFFEQADGYQGSFNLTRHEGRLYLAWQGGVAYLHGSEPGNPRRFSPVSGLGNQCWWFESLPDSAGRRPPALPVACTDGLYEIKGDRAVPVYAPADGTYRAAALVRSRLDPTRLWIGLFDGLASFRLEDGRWIDEGRVQEVTDQVRSVHENADGSVWAGTASTGLLLVSFASKPAPGLPRPDAKVERFGTAQGLPDGGIFVVPIAGEPYFVPWGGTRNYFVARFDSASRRFQRERAFDALPSDFLRAGFGLAEGTHGRVFANFGRGTAVFTKSGDGSWSMDRTTFNRQPVTAFGLLDRAELTADMILWPCSRLGVPPKFVQQWLDNDLPALLLGTLVPEGRQELEGVYRRVMAALGQDGASSFLQKQPLFL